MQLSHLLHITIIYILYIAFTECAELMSRLGHNFVHHPQYTREKKKTFTSRRVTFGHAHRFSTFYIFF